MGTRIDHTGQRFGRLTVMSQSDRRDGNGNIAWVCRCDCGQIATVGGKSLRAGDSRSCGCLFLEVAAEKGRRILRKHGMTGSPLHGVWMGMRERCSNPNDPKWNRYGGRGIRVCERWNSFENFAEDMGPRPDGMTIERDDVNGDYEPSNCRWATQIEQQNNRTNNRRLVIGGRTLTVAQAAREHGVLPDLVYERLRRGVPLERLFQPARPISRRQSS